MTMLQTHEIEAICNANHGNPFSVLGLHKRGAWVVTAFVPGADALWVLPG